MEHFNYSELIDELGGTAEVAELCHVSSQAVSKWRKEGIPEARLMFLMLAKPGLFSKPPWSYLCNSTGSPKRRRGEQRHE